MNLNPDSISALRQIPAFCDYAREKMLEDPDFWEREARFGSGIMCAAAEAVVAIGARP